VKGAVGGVAVYVGRRRVVVVDEGDARPLAGLGGGTEVRFAALRKIGAATLEEGARVCGAVEVCAVVRGDATLGEVLRAVREDVMRSLTVRRELLRELEEEEGEEGDAGRAAGTSYALPARVLCEPSDTGLPLSEYLLEGESVADDVVPRLRELLSWDDGGEGRYRFLQLEDAWVPGAGGDGAGAKGKAATSECMGLRAGGGDRAASDGALVCGIGAIALVAFAAVVMQFASR
jgi:Odorant response abnormal 4-like